MGTEREDSTAWPKITLVIPSLNSIRFIEDSILSVINQEYPNLEYIIVDGGSTDGTLEVIQKYRQHIDRLISEPDKGLYDALNKGFSLSSGEVMGWLGAMDLLEPNSLFNIGSLFRTFARVRWITGIATVIDEEGRKIKTSLKRWSRIRFLLGANRYIQQESTFWKRSLWEQAGGYLNDSYRNGGDFELWLRFFRFAQLYTVNISIGCWRYHSDALSKDAGWEYDRIIEKHHQKELDSMRYGMPFRAFTRIHAMAQRTPVLGKIWLNCITMPLYKVPFYDWPPVIEYSERRGWYMR